ARALARQILDDARAEADRLREAARTEIATALHNVDQLADRLVRDACAEAERVTARAIHDAERLSAQARARSATGSSNGAPAPAVPASRAAGTVDEVVGLIMRATVPGVALGEVVRIDRRDRE